MIPALTYDAHDLDIAVRTAWGEARGEGDDGVIATLWTIRNRVETDLGNDGEPDWWGEGIADVCLKPAQFSCWNAGDPNRPKLLALSQTSPAYRRIEHLAKAVFDGVIPDPTRGATHYVADTIAALPRWATSSAFRRQIGHHLFYRAA